MKIALNKYCYVCLSKASAKTAIGAAVINGLFESSFHLVSGKVSFVNTGHPKLPLILIPKQVLITSAYIFYIYVKYLNIRIYLLVDTIATLIVVSGIFISLFLTNNNFIVAQIEKEMPLFVD